MDLLELLSRPPISDEPLSFVVRPTLRGVHVQETIRQTVQLLAPRRQRDEVILFSHDSSPMGLPARVRGIRIRVLPISPTKEGSILSVGLAAATRPVVITADDRIAVEPVELRELLQRLNFADIVVGRRRRSGGWLIRPFERLVRAAFGIPLADPLSPVKAIRRAAVEGMILQSQDPLADFEMLAKATYLVSLVDEFFISDAWTGPGIFPCILSQSCESWKTWLRPILWRSSLTGEPAIRRLFEPSPQDTPPAGTRQVRFGSTRTKARRAQSSLKRNGINRLSRRAPGQFPSQ